MMSSSWQEMPGNPVTVSRSAWCETKPTAITRSKEILETSPKEAQGLRAFQVSGHLWIQDIQDHAHIMPPQTALAPLGTTEPSNSALSVVSLVQHIILNIAAKHATSAVLSEVRSRNKSCNASSLQALYQDIFGLLVAHDCRNILVQWANVMGKRKGQRYSEKPGWWPETVVHRQPSYLKSHGTFF